MYNIIYKFLEILSYAATPTALFAIGINLYNRIENWAIKQLITITTFKLIIHSIILLTSIAFIDWILHFFWLYRDSWEGDPESRNHSFSWMITNNFKLGDLLWKNKRNGNVQSATILHMKLMKKIRTQMGQGWILVPCHTGYFMSFQRYPFMSWWNCRGCWCRWHNWDVFWYGNCCSSSHCHTGW